MAKIWTLFKKREKLVLVVYINNINFRTIQICIIIRLRNEADEKERRIVVRHCNSVFSASDIWFLLDKDKFTQRKLYLANCPICNKKMALYSCYNNETNSYFEQYFYSGGADRVKLKYKPEITSTMLGFKTKYKAPSGFKYGKNVEIKKMGKVVGIRQYACDFYGNKILVKQTDNG